MKIVAVCPTYGRPSLVASVLACFERQDHSDRHLLILDDLGQLSGGGERWSVVSTDTRFPTLIDKYRQLYRLVGEHCPDWDAIAIMEDDDVYGPEWLSTHATGLETRLWSKPSQIYCTYGRDILGGDKAFLETKESCRGRFFASCAIRRELLEQIGGFQRITSKDFDLQHIGLWARLGGHPADPCEYSVPQYCYGWGRSNHGSGAMWSDDWYAITKPMDDTPSVKLEPTVDRMTIMLYRQLWHNWSPWEQRRRQGRCGTCDKVPRCLETHEGESSRFWRTWTCPRDRWRSERDAMSDEEIMAWAARDPTAGRTENPVITRRNLLFHLYPAKNNDLWRWHVDRIGAAAPIFNGRRVVAVATDENTHEFGSATERLHDFECFEAANDKKLRETATLRRLLARVCSHDPNEATFYGHSKGNATGNNVTGAEFWARMAYTRLIDDPERIQTVLRYWSAVGVNKFHLPPGAATPFPTGLRTGDWFYAGTFFWFRHDAVFAKPRWDDIASDTYGAEGWIGSVIDRHDVWSDYQPWPIDRYPTPDPYNPYCYVDEVLR